MAIASATSSASTNPGTSTRSSSPSRRDLGADRLALRAVAQDAGAMAGQASAIDRRDRRRALLGDVTAREHDGRRRRGGSRRGDVRRVAAPQPAQAHDLAAQPLVAQAALVQRAEDEGTRRQQDAQPLHGVADAPAQRAEVLLPVALRPDLEPVDRERHPRAHERGAAPRAARRTGTSTGAPRRRSDGGAGDGAARRRRSAAAARSRDGPPRRRAHRRATRRRPARPGSAAPRPAPTAPGSGR